MVIVVMMMVYRGELWFIVVMVMVIVMITVYCGECDGDASSEQEAMVMILEDFFSICPSLETTIRVISRSIVVAVGYVFYTVWGRPYPTPH